MDLHNNRVGLHLFSSVFDKKEKEIVTLLQEMMKKSEKAIGFEDFNRFLSGYARNKVQSITNKYKHP